MFDQVKVQSRGFAESAVRPLVSLGISPTQLTLAGFALSLVVAAVLGAGDFRVGGALLLLAAAFDTLDGALARVADRATRFGAFLDSTLDRYSEAAQLLGILYAATRLGDLAVAVLCFVVVVGSLLVSYTRARAEGLGLRCEVGIAPRPERVVLLGLGLILGLQLPALAILAVLTHVTAIQRILHVESLLREQAGG